MRSVKPFGIPNKNVMQGVEKYLFDFVFMTQVIGFRVKKESYNIGLHSFASQSLSSSSSLFSKTSSVQAVAGLVRLTWH